MGRAPCCDKEGLKRGPWTPEEDKILVDYITAHGHGSWRSLPKLAGLLRCGKSCRLRWTNYLRPDIKRGPFTNEEQKSIIQLHAIVGNKWSTIAAQLPGRTDNEIKNYWNTHLKKKLLKLGVDPDAPYLPAAAAAGLVGAGPGGLAALSIDHNHNLPLSGPATPPPSSATRHMTQWESARLEAEARLSRESQIFSSASGVAGSADVYGEGEDGTASSSEGHENEGDGYDDPPDVFLRLWNSNVGRLFRTSATPNTVSTAGSADATGCSPAASSSTRPRQAPSVLIDVTAPGTVKGEEEEAHGSTLHCQGAVAFPDTRMGLKHEVEETDDSSKLSSGSGAIADCSWTSSNDFVPASATDHEDGTNDAAAAAAAAEESYQMYLDFATAAVDDMAGLFHAHVGGGGFSTLFAADLSEASLDSAFK